MGVPLRFNKRIERVCRGAGPSSILSGAADGSNCALTGLNKKTRLAVVRAITCSLRIVCAFASGNQQITAPKAALLMACSITHNRSAGLQALTIKMRRLSSLLQNYF